MREIVSAEKSHLLFLRAHRGDLSYLTLALPQYFRVYDTQIQMLRVPRADNPARLKHAYLTTWNNPRLEAVVLRGGEQS